jgi:hypothetical protein
VTPSSGSAFFRPNILMAGVDGLAECTSPAHRPTGTRRSSSTDISVSAPANEGLPSSPRIKVLAWGRDPDTTKVTELEQMMVTGDDRVGSGGKRALEDPVVGLVLEDDAYRLPGMNGNREPADRRSRLSHPRRRPAKLAGQHAADLVEDRWGDADLNQTGTTESEHFVGEPAKFKAEM